MWLGSSNVAANTGFYNSLGFKTVEIFFLGNDNPTWTEDPIPIALVSARPVTEWGLSKHRLCCIDAVGAGYDTESRERPHVI